MKPVKLYMKNIGPYRDESLDFTKLDNMFLIKGDTGAGKTFIFEAITFALYGTLRGSRKNHERTIKSRYAEEKEESFVNYTFEVDGKIYRVNRSVPFFYTNRKGQIDNKQSQVSLEEFVDGSFQAIPGGTSEINKKITSIIGLSADEFSLVVVLPQGEFANFLHESSSKRTETLEKLFPVDFFDGITERIKVRADTAGAELKTLDGLILSLSQGRDFSKGEETISAYDKEIKDLEKKKTSSEIQKEEFLKENENLKHEKDDALEYQTILSKYQSLKNQEKDFKELEKKVQKGDKAKGLKADISLYKKADSDFQENRRSLEENENALKILKKELSSLESQWGEIEKIKEDTEGDRKELTRIEEKLKRADQLKNNRQEMIQAKEKLEKAERDKKKIQENIDIIEKSFGGKAGHQCQKELSDKLSILKDKENDLRNECLDAKKKEENLAKKEAFESELKNVSEELKKEDEKKERTKATLDELKKTIEDDKRKHLAFTLSSVLKAGEACPVCGSKEHPAPAEKPEGLLDYSELEKTTGENLESIQANINNIEKEKARLEAEIKNCLAAIEECKTERKFLEVEKELKKTQGELEERVKENDSLNEKLLKYESLKSSLEEARNIYEGENQTYTRLKSSVEELEKLLGKDIEKLSDEYKILSDRVAENIELSEKWQKAYDENQKNITLRDGLVKSCKDKDLAYKKTLEEIWTRLEKELEKSPFASLEEAEEALLEEEELEAKRKSLSEYREELKSAEDAVEAGKKKKTREISEIEGQIEVLQGQLEKIQLELTEIQNSINEKNKEYIAYKHDFEKSQTAQKQKLLLEEEIKPLKALSDNLAGKNPKDLPFKSWALGMYFEQVVDFASRRFEKISDGRFSFRLKESDDVTNSKRGYKGLDLLVYDSYNGKTSDAAELSGGETFEASISLALAITDVVQNNNGGKIKLDSLFIDEGFGSLDPETLEKAMQVLCELSETKMIGMISHVTELENFPGITSSISVEKSSTGSRIR
ncbi:MAG: AAA family ATPase [Treponema sp.]|nr:AAA family ATPase [Treponema sp.]